jgi:hypothetical protein
VLFVDEIDFLENLPFKAEIYSALAAFSKETAGPLHPFHFCHVFRLGGTPSQ